MPEEADLNINGRFLDPRHKAKMGQAGYLVPLRLVAENMGAEVSWSPERGAIVLSKKGRSYDFNVASTMVVVDGQRQDLPELVRTYHGHAFAPVDFVAKALGAAVYYSQDTGTLFLLRQEPALAGRRIVLDPGHGGDDWGASVNQITEKELALDISGRAAVLLERAGMAVYLTRTGDQSIGRRERTMTARSLEANLLVTIHVNSSSIDTLEGVESYYYASWQSQRLAGEILSEVIAESKAVNRGVKEAAFDLLRHAQVPSAHLESGFLTNPGEYTRLIEPRYREKIAIGLFRGVRAYLETSSATKIIDNSTGDGL